MTSEMAPEMERRIFIRDLRLQVSIGIHDFEKDGPQTVVVNVDLLLGSAKAAHGDRIANVLNYDVVHDGIVALAKSLWSNRQLILQMTQREVVGRYKGSVMGLACRLLSVHVAVLPRGYTVRGKGTVGVLLFYVGLGLGAFLLRQL